MTQYKMSDQTDKSNEYVEESKAQRNAKEGKQKAQNNNSNSNQKHTAKEKARGSEQQRVPGQGESAEMHNALSNEKGDHQNGPTDTSEVQERLANNNIGVDSDSQGSSSNAYAEPPSIGDVADDLSELSDLEVCILVLPVPCNVCSVIASPVH